MRPRIILADDHAMVADGLARIVVEIGDVVATVHDGVALVDAARRLKPDLVARSRGRPETHAAPTRSAETNCAGRTIEGNRVRARDLGPYRRRPQVPVDAHHRRREHRRPRALRDQAAHRSGMSRAAAFPYF